MERHYKRQFRLTSTNPCVGTLSDATSNSVNSLLLCAHRFAIGESNCDGCEHYYAITNRETGRSLIMHSSELLFVYSRRYPWSHVECDVNFDKFSRVFLAEACDALECTADEIEFPLIDEEA